MTRISVKSYLNIEKGIRVLVGVLQAKYDVVFSAGRNELETHTQCLI
jgi:hypothetical protein